MLFYEAAPSELGLGGGRIGGVGRGAEHQGERFVPLIVLPWLALYARDALVPALVCGATVGPELHRDVAVAVA